MAVDMTWLYFGSFEEILHSYIMPRMAHIELIRLLITAPNIDSETDERDKNALRLSIKISSPDVSNLRSGKICLTKEMLSPYQAAEALENTKRCFRDDIVPRIQLSEHDALLRKILDLIECDDTLSEEMRADLKGAAEGKNLEDFLSEVYLFAAQRPRKQLLPPKPEKAKSDTYTNADDEARLDLSADDDGTNSQIPPPGGKDETKPANPQSHYILIGMCIVTVVAVVFLLGYIFFPWRRAAVSEIFVTGKEITLKPEEKHTLQVAVLPTTAMDSPLNFISSDPALVTVSHTGVVTAHDDSQGLAHRNAEITIQAESGATLTKEITVDFSDTNPFVQSPTDFFVWQRVRIAGENEWHDQVEAKVGDTVEIQIQYKNTDENGNVHEDVMIKNILPKNLQYIEGSTKLYNGNFPDGSTYTTDTLMTTGVNIGHYNPNANAFVRFEAVIVDESLEIGANTLVNWSQAGVYPETIQDYAAVVVHKTE